MPRVMQLMNVWLAEPTLLSRMIVSEGRTRGISRALEQVPTQMSPPRPVSVQRLFLLWGSALHTWLFENSFSESNKESL